MKRFLSAMTAAAALAAGGAVAQSPGVSDTEVKIGGAHDMSGPFSAFSAPAVQAAQLYFEEVNANGGVHGRKIVYITEDHGYQVPKALQAANKLINRDEIFAMLLNLGTPTNLAMFKLMGPKNIPNVYPLTAARQIIDPPAPWKFAGGSAYYDHTRATLGFMADNEGASKVCAMFLPTDFGTEIQAAIKDEAAERGLEYVGETTHKPDEKDFAGALGKLREAGCDTVGLALTVSQLITTVVTANKMGISDMKFVVSSAGFHTVVAKALAKNGVNAGLYAGSGWQDIESRIGVPEVATWVKKYTEATGEKFPGTGAVLGRIGAELMVRALEAAGTDLTRESFIAAMETLNYEDKIGGTTVTMSADDHVAGDDVFVSKIESGSWVLSGTIN